MFIPHVLPLRHPSSDMSNGFELDAQFSAIMNATRGKPVPHLAGAFPSSNSGANDNVFISQPGDGCGPSRVRRNKERASPYPSTQMVCDPFIFPIRETELGYAKKYDTIVKGFKVLEASYEELQTLGTRAQIPTGCMVKTLRSQSTCDSNMPSDQMLSTF